MTRFAELLRFELRYQLRQPGFAVTAVLLFIAAIFAVTSDAIQMARGGSIHVNSPYAVTLTHLVLSIVGMFLAGHFAGTAATRDRSHGMAGLVLATPATGASRYWGQLLGATGICLLAFVAVSLGTLLGSYWPEIDAERVGATRLSPYLWSYLVFVLPNFAFCTAMLYALARSARSLMGMYLGLVAFFVLYEVSTTLLDNPATRALSVLLDPFGFSAFSEATRYWTPAEKNTLLVPFEGALRANRLLWLGVAAVVTLLTLRLHDERRPPRDRRKPKRDDARAAPVPVERLAGRAPVGPPSRLRQLLERTRLEIVQLIGNPSFLILCLLSLFILVGALLSGDSYYGTRSWPLTRMLSETIQGALGLLILIVLTYYAAESVWRDRERGIAELVDATSVPGALLYLPKLLSLWAVIVGLLGVGVGFAVAFQVANGYTDFEWSVYAATLTLQYLLPAMLIAVLSLLIQVLSPNKYVGMLAFGGYVVASLVLPRLGLEHHLWRYSEGPEAIYSDMNGLGHYLPALLWYHAYWASLAVVLVVLGMALWPRGSDRRARSRLRALPAAIGRPGAVALFAGLGAFALSGGVIVYNTTVLNDYENRSAGLDRRADYERTLSAYESRPHPTITDVQVAVDFYPTERRLRAAGRYRLVNRSQRTITELLVGWDRANRVTLSIDGGEITTRYDTLDAAVVTLSAPLVPGAERTMDFVVERDNHGFRDGGEDTQLVGNGSFINNQQLLPRLGYDLDQELDDPAERRKRGLPEPRRMPALEDASQYTTTYLGADVSRVQLDLVLSTARDQTAIAPGRLERAWHEDDRAYFHYRTASPVQNFFAVLSGRYDVVRDNHDGVDIAVFHHPPHSMNVARMIGAVRDSLDYFSAQFGPYQHEQIRIVEFPRYVRFAQSFAGTIPYSEDIGFVADLRDPGAIDYVYSVTAHEVAHQWWGHQVTPANVEGAAVLSESLAQYSAYMLIRKRYGRAYLRRFLQWELDRYLRGRANETIAEQPLMRAERQPYIHYQKGGLALYALAERIGEARLNAALRDFLARFRFSTDRYPTTLDLLEYLTAATDADDRALLDDLFRRITLYDLAVVSAQGRQNSAGQFVVDLRIEASKHYADAQGTITSASLDERIEVALLSAHPDAPMQADDVQHLESHEIVDGDTELTIVSDERPAYVSIDPFLTRIDRDSDDNTIAISWADEP